MFSATLRQLAVPLKLFQKRLAETLSEAIAESARVWLDATVTEIPTWSGASRATFIPLASQVNFHVLAAQSPTSFTNRVSLGLSNADGDVEVRQANQGIVHFTYLTSLPHLIWNEFNNANISPDPTKFPPPAKLIQPGPYHFQAKGQAAFERHAQTVKLPSPFPLRVSRTLTV